MLGIPGLFHQFQNIPYSTSEEKLLRALGRFLPSSWRRDMGDSTVSLSQSFICFGCWACCDTLDDFRHCALSWCRHPWQGTCRLAPRWLSFWRCPGHCADELGDRISQRLAERLRKPARPATQTQKVAILSPTLCLARVTTAGISSCGALTRTFALTLSACSTGTRVGTILSRSCVRAPLGLGNPSLLASPHKVWPRAKPHSGLHS